MTVHVSGKAELIKTESESIALLEKLTEINEARYAGGWNLDQLGQVRIKALLKKIVFFKIKISNMEGKAKLSQNRSKMDRVGVMQNFASSSNSELQTLSKLMKLDLKPEKGE